LNNNGIFRAEMLYQFQEINKNLTALAELKLRELKLE